MSNNSKGRRIARSRTLKLGGADPLAKLAARRALFALLAIGLLSAGVAGFFISGPVAQAQETEPSPPGEPTNLRGSAFPGDPIRDLLAWDVPASDGGAEITGYQVQREVTTGHEWGDPFNTGSTTNHYIAVKPSSDDGYVYRVRAVNSAGHGPWSNEVTVGGVPTWKSGEEGTPTATPHPSLPQVTLDWTGRLQHDGGKPITSWTLVRKKAGSDVFTNFISVDAGTTVFTVTGLEYNTRYVFRVGTHNIHRGSLADTVEATTVGSSPTTDLQVTDKSDQNRDPLTWTAPTDTGGSAITDYQLGRRATSSDSWEAPIDTGSTDTAYTVHKPGWGTGYVYRVRAVNNGNPGAWSDEITVAGKPTWQSGEAGTPTTTPHATLPQITLDWAGKLSHDGGKPVTKWQWRMKEAGSSDFVWKGELPAGQTSVIATGLEYGTAYDFDVSAYNGDRWSYTSADAHAITAAQDRAPLIDLYNATDGANWSNNTNWLSDKPLGEWAGVSADDLGRVIRLELSHHRMNGSIPESFGNLSELSHLHLDGNALTGQIPAGFGNLSRLEYASLMDNQLTGPLPAELGNLANLEELHLTNNSLTGQIPDTLAGMAKLRILYLNNREGHDEDIGLTGPIPASVGSMPSLEILVLDRNKLTGPIPTELASSTSLRRIAANHNQITGAIPTELGDMRQLEIIGLAHNDLSGTIPSELGKLTLLQRLSLHDNEELSGPVPASIGEMNRLYRLAISNTRLNGALPFSLTNLGAMSELFTDGTRLCAPTDDAFQQWLSKVTHRRVQNCQ